MSIALTIVLALIAALVLIFGVIRVSMWITDRKEASTTQNWTEATHAGGDGWPMHGDAGSGDCGGGD